MKTSNVQTIALITCQKHKWNLPIFTARWLWPLWGRVWCSKHFLLDMQWLKQDNWVESKYKGGCGLRILAILREIKVSEFITWCTEQYFTYLVIKYYNVSITNIVLEQKHRYFGFLLLESWHVDHSIIHTYLKFVNTDLESVLTMINHFD